MAKRDKSSKAYPYLSRFSSNPYYISAAEVVVEKLCENRAKLQQSKLPDRFWDDLRWKQLYKSQSLLAKGILKIYSLESILYALNGSCSKIYTLTSPKIDMSIQEFLKKKKQLEAAATQKVEDEIIIPDDIKNEPKTQYKNPNNLLGRL